MSNNDHIAKELEFGIFFSIVCAGACQSQMTKCRSRFSFRRVAPGSKLGRVSRFLYSLSQLATQELDVKCLNFSLDAGIRVIFITLLHFLSNNFVGKGQVN